MNRRKKRSLEQKAIEQAHDRHVSELNHLIGYLCGVVDAIEAAMDLSPGQDAGEGPVQNPHI